MLYKCIVVVCLYSSRVLSCHLCLSCHLMHLWRARWARARAQAPSKTSWAGPGPGPLVIARNFFQKPCPWKSNMSKMNNTSISSLSGNKNANIIPPAQMIATAKTAPKFCANIRAERPEMFVLDLNSYGISGNIETWPECQPEESRPECQPD